MLKFEEWSLYAYEDLIEITNFTMKHWGPTIVDRFENDLRVAIEKVKKNPRISPDSELLPGSKKCVVNKHVSLFYGWDRNTLYIQRLFANKKDPRDLRM